MSFNWNYKYNTLSIIGTNELVEIRNNLDSIKDYTDCNALCDTFNSDFDTNIYSSQDISKDTNDNTTIYLSYNGSVDSIDYLNNLTNKDSVVYDTQNSSLNNTKDSTILNSQYTNLFSLNDSTVLSNNLSGKHSTHCSYDYNIVLSAVDYNTACYNNCGTVNVTYNSYEKITL